jgi:prenylcysteine oxidase/farnesylcysteine lyase
LGASIFIEANRILWEAVERHNLKLVSPHLADPKAAEGGDEIGIWDGERFVLTQTGSSGWWDLAKLVWRYGPLSPWRVNGLVKAMIGRFLRLYEPGVFPFTNIGETALEIGLLELSGVTGEELMKTKGISRKFYWEVVQAATRVNYAQNLNLISGLATLVSMAPEGAVAVEGGNWRIFENMAAQGADKVHLDTPITHITRNTTSGEYTLSSPEGDFKTFDEVIIASPYQYTSLNVTPALAHTPDSVPYVTLYVTLFASRHTVSPEAFDLPEDKDAPLVILTTLSPDDSPPIKYPYPGKAGFFSISLLGVFNNPTTFELEYVYKVFSPTPMTTEFLANIMGIEDVPDSMEEFKIKDVSWVHQKVWQSYPVELPRVTFEEMKLDEGIWYTGGMDSFISTMETNALMGMNVARLMVDGWLKKGLDNQL